MRYVILGVLLICGALAGVFFVLNSQAPEPSSSSMASIETDAPTSPAQPLSDAVQATDDTPQPVETGDDTAGRVDIIRMDDSGTITIAGQAQPNVSLKILLDEQEIGEIQTDANGMFASMSQYTSSAASAQLSIVESTSGEAAVAQEFLLTAPVAPREAPTVTVEAASVDVDAPAAAEEVETASNGSEVEAAPTPLLATNSLDPATTVEPPAPSSDDTVDVDNVQSSSSTPVAEAKSTDVETAAGPSILALSENGDIDVLQPSVTLTPEALSVDAIGYTETGDMVVTGVTGGEGKAVVYLDNTMIAVQNLDTAGSWSVTLPEVDTGTYTMRVDRVTPTGEVVSRVETPVAKESAEVLAQIAPTAQTITVQPGFTLWRIASDRYGSGIEYVKVFSANQDKIKNPDLIYPGQVFSLPQ